MSILDTTCCPTCVARLEYRQIANDGRVTYDEPVRWDADSQRHRPGRNRAGWR